jgi:hypothetical protein
MLLKKRTRQLDVIPLDKLERRVNDEKVVDKKFIQETTHDSICSKIEVDNKAE